LVVDPSAGFSTGLSAALLSVAGGGDLESVCGLGFSAAGGVLSEAWGMASRMLAASYLELETK